MKMKRRTKIRIASFSVGLFAAMLIWGVSASVQVKELKLEKNAAQQQALMQVTEYLEKIQTTLTKASYAGSSEMLGILSSDLHSQALGAKTGLAALSAGGNSLYNMYKFFSQVGEYTQALSKKADRREEITGEEQETLKTLLGYADSLSRQFSYMSELLDAGYFSFEEIKNELMDFDRGSESMVSFISAANDAEESMDDFPSLIYDGPFSDNILTKESDLLKGAEEISKAKAKEIAGRLLKAEAGYVLDAGEAEGKIAAYDFTVDNTRIAITKRGGYVSYILSDYSAGEEKITAREAQQKAEEFLSRCGYKDMASTYAATYDGVRIINFAWQLGQYTAYPDLIKVGVSMSDGRIVSLDARDYLMNHVSRTVPEALVSVDAARSVVNGSLEIRNVDFALIPTPGGGEHFTYEFLCEDEDGQDVLVYVSTTTGEEEDILILLYSDGGTLTK